MDKDELLSRCSIFSEMSQRDVARLARVAVPRHYAAGQVILNEGETGIAMFVVSSGRVEVVKDTGRSALQVATLGPGDFFGEMALFEGFPRSHTVRAVEETECLALSRWDFLAELRAHPEIALQMLPIYARRLRHAQDSVTH